MKRFAKVLPSTQLITRSVFLFAVLLFLFSNTASVSARIYDGVFNDTPWYKQESGCAVTGTPVGPELPGGVPEPHKTLFTQAAANSNVNAQFLAAIFLSENGNEWRPFDTPWPTSSAGASGPFQFMPATWDGYATDGDGDGVADRNNIHDAAYAAAKFISALGGKADTQLGDINTPFQPDTLLRVAAAYNWGPGNVDIHTTPTSPLSVAPLETEYYVKNIHSLITSGFTKSGHPNYRDPSLPGGGSPPATGTNCSPGVVAGDIVQTALSFAWDTPGHGKDKEDAKPSYQVAMPQYNGSTGEDEFSDCGVFVATVMIASGVDPDYVKRSTSLQIDYLRGSGKYQVLDNVSEISQLQPGDILINTQHTYIYVGDQPKGFNSVSASLHGHVPEASAAYLDLNGEHFLVVRVK